MLLARRLDKYLNDEVLHAIEPAIAEILEELQASRPMIQRGAVGYTGESLLHHIMEDPWT